MAAKTLGGFFRLQIKKIFLKKNHIYSGLLKMSVFLYYTTTSRKTKLKSNVSFNKTLHQFTISACSPPKEIKSEALTTSKLLHIPTMTSRGELFTLRHSA